MANTLTVVDRQVEGLNRIVYATMDITSYTADGETLSATIFGLTALKFVEVCSAENGYMFAANSAMNKLLGFTAAATQIVATTDAGLVRLRAVGY